MALHQRSGKLVTKNEIAVVIPTYNRYEITRVMLDLLAAQTNQNFITIIVDSGSVDGTKDLAAENNCILLDVGNDVWWTGAIEYGVNYANSLEVEWILVLNDDIKFDVNFIESMLQASKDNPDSINVPSQTDMSGNIFNGYTLSPFLKNRQPMEVGPYRKTGYSIDIGNGCALMFASSLPQSICLFDEKNCPHYGGDVYLFLTAKKFGVEIKVHPSISILQTSVTSPLSYLSFSTILKGKGSIFNFRTHVTLGLKMYGSVTAFLSMGMLNNFRYGKGVASAFFSLLSKNNKL